jgi:Fanconi anemia group M protein
MPEKFLKNITPRQYQTEIFESCKDKNSLIILPTGVGKTLIGLMLAIHRMKKHPLEKIVLLAPTKPLAEQHFEYFKKHLPELFAEMNLFTGMVKAEERKKLWQRTDIIFSTPQCIANDLKKRLYNLAEVSLLIEDEAHRCVKNYSYTFVAEKYFSQSQNTQIIGLTASPGKDKKTIKKICENLSTEHVEIRTRVSEDVKPHLQELEFNTIKIPFPKPFDEIRILLKKLFDRNIEVLREKSLLYGPANKITLLELQKKISNNLRTNSQNFSLYHGASRCAQALKISHALELLETQTLSSLKSYFESQKEQARKNQSKAVKSFISSPEFIQSEVLVNNLLEENLEHPKLLELKSLIEDKIIDNPKTKIIVFAQYRDSITTICRELNKIKKIKAKSFVGQAKKTDSGLTQKEQKQIIDDFSKGNFNILCATSIGEEGLDIPEVNAVIFYEPVPSAIRKIQRTGRTARLIPGELIMLITTGTRDEAYYWSAIRKEKTMHKALDEIKSDLKQGKLNFKSKQKQLS